MNLESVDNLGLSGSKEGTMREASSLQETQNLNPETSKEKLTADRADEALKVTPLMNYAQYP